MKQLKTILIADDSSINRSILCDILKSDYDVIEVENGIQALRELKNKAGNIALMLLDIHMPGIDGFQILEEMRKHIWGKDVPVIIISSETSLASIRQGFSYGVIDYIQKPFDHEIIQQRIRNTIMLYSKLDNLKDKVNHQVMENEKNNTLMINILSSVVEFRNGESGLHVIRIRAITEILLNQFVKEFPQQELDVGTIKMISNAAALHDIGKISIPEKILNKPGKLTDEEYAIMKQHTVIADDMISNLKFGKRECLLQYCHEICRWHHERWDGMGYPDGLKGEEIPISAQVVSLADVYDALVSERVYKKPYSHRKAVHMIMNHECGVFNPQIMKCFLSIADTIDEKINEYCRKQENIFDLYYLVNEELTQSEIEDVGPYHKLLTHPIQHNVVYDTNMGEYLITERLLHSVAYGACVWLYSHATQDHGMQEVLSEITAMRKDFIIVRSREEDLLIYFEDDEKEVKRYVAFIKSLWNASDVAYVPEHGRSLMELYVHVRKGNRQ